MKLVIYPTPSLEEMVARMRRVGEALISYTYPLAPKNDAEDIAPLKLTQFMIDGYEVHVQYTKADFGKYYLESVEILGKNSPFLPFVVVCKIAKAFLGEEYLAYLEYFADNRRRYCWTLAKDKEDDTPIPGPFKVEMEVNEFEGLEYSVLPTGQIDFH